jgi:hypothetical protein
MSKAQQVFEALMRTKGYTEFTMNKTGKYTVPSLQMRWTYFQLGWEMRGVTAWTQPKPSEQGGTHD